MFMCFWQFLGSSFGKAPTRSRPQLRLVTSARSALRSMASSSHSVAPHLKSLIGSMFGTAYHTFPAQGPIENTPAHQRILNLWNDDKVWGDDDVEERLSAKEEQLDIEHKQRLGFDPNANTVAEVTGEEPDAPYGKGEKGPTGRVRATAKVGTQSHL